HLRECRTAAAHSRQEGGELPQRGGRTAALGRARRADDGAAAGSLGRREATRGDRARGDRSAGSSARGRADRQRRSLAGAGAAAAVHRAPQIGNIDRRRHPRHRVDGPVRRATPRAPRGTPARVRLRRAMPAEYPDKPSLQTMARMPVGDGPHIETPIVPRGSISGSALVAVVAIMTFLAALTTGAVVLIAGAASEWQSDVAREVTIQIRPGGGRDVEAEVNKAVQ